LTERSRLGYLSAAMRRLGIVAGIVLIGVAVALFFLYSQTEVERALRRGDWVHILIVGVDNGAQGAPQADLVALASISPQGHATWLSLPRDIHLPTGPGSWTPLYAVYSQEGTDGVRSRVERLLEVDIPYWVEVDFAAFRDLVDQVGGVEITVEAHLVYVDQSQDLYIDIPAGHQRLDGEQALQYVRYRGADGEVGRIRRMHKFLTALISKLKRLPWSRWRGLVRTGLEHVKTNLDFWEILDVAGLARDLPPGELRFTQAPTLTDGGQPRPDLIRLHRLVEALYHGREYLTRDEVHVTVLNGSGAPFLAHRTAAWLKQRGFSVAGVDNADTYGYKRTLVLYNTPEGLPKAELLSEVLPQRAEIMEADMFGVERLQGWPEGADVVLILGEGFDVKL